MVVGNAVDLTICPTMACNFDCPYCFESHRAGRMSEKTQSEVITLAARLMSVSGARRLNVTWFGGEPLLAPDIIEDLSGKLISLAGLTRARHTASIVTNGYFLTPQVAEMLGRCGVSEAQVTIDGVGAFHDKTRHLAGGGATFERITENLRSTKLPFHVSIRHNIHEGNCSHLDKLPQRSLHSDAALSPVCHGWFSVSLPGFAKAASTADVGLTAFFTL